MNDYRGYEAAAQMTPEQVAEYERSMEEGWSPPMTPEQAADYERWTIEQERLCHAGFTTGPAHDPYGTSCDLERGHDGPHQGDDPFGGPGRVEWRGGGFCMGDPLPTRDVVWHPAPEAANG